MATSSTQDNMRIDWDVSIEMDDGVAMRADVFRPLGGARYPVLLTYGPYAKGLAFQEGYPSAWNRMVEQHPDVAAGSSCKYQNWEVVDPEKWVPHGYVAVRVDSRGCGRSPGLVDPFSPRETRDYFDCIEWAARQPWSNGKVGLNGVSYFGMNQWQVASLQPPHLAAMCVWEGASDFYRDASYHGGILSTFWANWYDMQVKSVQHGLGERGPRSRVTGDLVCGPLTLDEAVLAINRIPFGAHILAHPCDDRWHRDRSAAFENIEVPLLSAGNWGGQGLHLRGNVEGFVRAASPMKWLEMHGAEHWTHFYTDYGLAIQRLFFDHFLKGEPNGWAERRRVQLQVRHTDRFEERFEDAWPLPGTRWTKLYLHGHDRSLSLEPAATARSIEFDALGDGVDFLGLPLAEPMEITGPLASALTVSSTTTDADIFLVLRVYGPEGSEVTFQGAIDPHTPVAQGWLRASHRQLDPALSQPYRPYHTHRAAQWLTPGEPVEVEVEILPTSIVVPAGHRLCLSVRGRDYEFAKSTGARLSNFKNELLGCGPFIHVDPDDRPAAVYAGRTTLHLGGASQAHVVVPVVPAVRNVPVLSKEETP